MNRRSSVALLALVLCAAVPSRETQAAPQDDAAIVLPVVAPVQAIEKVTFETSSAPSCELSAIGYVNACTQIGEAVVIAELLAERSSRESGTHTLIDFIARDASDAWSAVLSAAPVKMRATSTNTRYATSGRT